MRVLRHHVLKAVSRPRTRYRVNFTEYWSEHSKLCTLIHDDMARSIFRAKQYLEKSQISPQTAQAVFEHLVVDALASVPEALDLYYQASTDCLELVLITFLDTAVLSKRQRWFKVTQNTFETFHGSVEDFFTIDYELLLEIVRHVYLQANQLYIERGHNVSLAQLVMDQIRTNDGSLYQLTQRLDPQELQLIMMRYTRSLCLHMTDSLDVSFKLLNTYLSVGFRQFAQIIQRIISVSVRACTPLLLDGTYRSFRLDAMPTMLTGIPFFDVKLALSDAPEHVLTDTNSREIQKLLGEEPRNTTIQLMNKMCCIE